MKKADQNIIEGIHYASGDSIRIRVEGGLISSITKIHTARGEKGRVGLPVIAPGLLDLQVNGYRGIDFNAEKLTGEMVRKASRELEAIGVLNFYPTLITGPLERVSASLEILAGVMDLKEDGPLPSGIHLEGPFISPEDGPRGAHPKKYCLQPDAELLKGWQEKAGGHIKILTLAPELEGSEKLIRVCQTLGILVALGHTAASGEDIQRAVDAGAVLSTHLGNGAHQVLPRHPNYIWEQLAEDRLWASMIADGFHLSDSVLKIFARMKGDRAILVSDGMCYAGMEPGTYDSPAAGRVTLTAEGKLHLEGNPGTLAGSATGLDMAVRHMSRITGFATAWDMASVNPARLMYPDRARGLSEGAPAKLLLLNEDGSIKELFKA